MATINVTEKKQSGVYTRKRNGKIVGYYARGWEKGKEIYLGYSIDYNKAVALRVTWEVKRDTEIARIEAVNLHKSNNTVKNALSKYLHEFTPLNLDATAIIEWTNMHFLKYFNRLQNNLSDSRHIKNENQLQEALSLLDAFKIKRPPFTNNSLFKDYIDWMFAFIANTSNEFDFVTVRFMTNDAAYKNFIKAKPALLKRYKEEAAYERRRKQFKEQEEREKQCEI